MNKNLLKAIDNIGIKYRHVTMTDGKNGIMLDTNYPGLYPNKESLDKHYIVSKIIKRYPAYRTEARGYYTAILITEK